MTSSIGETNTLVQHAVGGLAGESVGIGSDRAESLDFLSQHCTSRQELGHNVRVHVRRRSAVLQVAEALVGHSARNTNRGASVRHASRELIVRGGLVATGQSSQIVLAALWIVVSNVRVVVDA